MKIFNTKPDSVTVDEAAAAVRLGSITSRSRVAPICHPVIEELVERQLKRRLFWTPDELSAVSSGE